MKSFIKKIILGLSLGASLAIAADRELHILKIEGAEALTLFNYLCSVEKSYDLCTLTSDAQIRIVSNDNVRCIRYQPRGQVTPSVKCTLRFFAGKLVKPASEPLPACN